jgi:hypothetical protein
MKRTIINVACNKSSASLQDFCFAKHLVNIIQMILIIDIITGQTHLIAIKE